MIEEQGTVVEVAEAGVIVEVVRTSACQSCKARQGCGQAVLAEWGDNEKQAQKNHFHIPYDKPAQVGDVAVLGMEHDAVSKVAVLVYIVPLILGFAGLLFGSWLALGELLQLAIFSVLFLLSFVFISRLKVNKSPVLVPKILRLSPASKGFDIIASTASKTV